MVEAPFRREQERQISIETARKLNESFRVGDSVWQEDNLCNIRSLCKPICVDFNGVLVNQGRPWVPNPEAKSFIADLNKLGTVVVVTNAYGDWDLRQQALQRFEMWHEGMILMTVENWNSNFVRHEEADERRRMQATDEFTDLKKLPSGKWASIGAAANAKYIGHIFMKDFDVPIIDDDEIHTGELNPGMIGIFVRSFRGKSSIEDEPRLNLKQASELVRNHYTSPFKATLVDFNRNKVKKDSRPYGLYGIKGMPDYLIRALDGYSPNIKSCINSIVEFLNNRSELKKLRDDYGMHIPDFDVVIGGPVTGKSLVTYYTVVERIKGDDLQRIEFKLEEMEEAALKIDKCFTGIAHYLADITKKSGWYISDIAVAGLAYCSGNEQYVYGTKLGEKEKQVYFTDLGPALAYYNVKDSGSHQQFYYTAAGLYGMIMQMERKLGGRKLSRARNSLLDFFHSIPATNRYYEKMQKFAEIVERDGGLKPFLELFPNFRL